MLISSHDDKTRRIFRFLEVRWPTAQVIEAGGYYSRVDAMVVAPGPGGFPTLQALYEIKTRNTLPDDHAEYSIANNKIEAMQHLTLGLQTKGSLIVCFSDDSLYRWRIADRGELLTRGAVIPSKNGPIRYLPSSEREYLGHLPAAA